MKMLKFIFTACLLSMFVMACEGPAGRDGKDGWDGRDGKIEKYFITVMDNEWNYSKSQGLYYKTFAFPEIDKFIVDDGLVMVYWEDLSKTPLVKWPLPFTKRVDKGIQEYYQFEYQVGKLTIYLEPSDFYTGYTPPTIDFDVSVVWMD